MSERIGLKLSLLDRQVVDREGELVGKVDDLELQAGPDGRPCVVALLLGEQALLGRLRRRRAPDRPARRIDAGLIDEIGSDVRLRCLKADLPESPLEARLRTLVRRIPGSSRAGQ